MASALSLPLALQPHHDGSALYVPQQKPALLERVKVRIRIHAAIGKVKAVRVRFSESGEAFPTGNAKVIKRANGWAWYETSIVMHNPHMNYRWYIELANGEIYWLNAHGVTELEQPDIHDFKINTFSSAPEWGKSAVMYQIFPDRFARSAKADQHKLPKWAIAKNWGDEVIGSGPGTSEQFFGGDIWGIIDHLDHLKKLGVTLLYLTPVFPGRSNHRYDASSFSQVDPLLGGDEALIALVEAAHKKGFKVIGDLTSNHSGDGHEWFKAAYKNPSAKESDYYYFSDGNKKYDAWFGVPSLPKFNWKSQELRKLFVTGKNSIVARWIKKPFNMDGWRIDVANMTGRIRDENMYLEISELIRHNMQAINPNTILLGEYTGDAAFNMQGEGWHGGMTYMNFTKPVWRWFYNPREKREAGFLGLGRTRINGLEMMQQHIAFAAGFPWHVRLHNMNPLDTHDIPRFKTFAIKGAQRVAAGMQFTFPGMPVIWAGVLARSGYFPISELSSLRQVSSYLQGHPTSESRLPGIRIASGSLGQGLSAAVGAALGLRIDGKEGDVFCLMGDGECQEGQIWEAAMSASHYGLGKIIGIVDYNNLQIDGEVSSIMSVEPFADKWRSFGWDVCKCDGNDMEDFISTVEKIKSCRDRQKPTVILATTIMGKGVHFFEGSMPDKSNWHGKPPSKDDAAKALVILAETRFGDFLS